MDTARKASKTPFCASKDENLLLRTKISSMFLSIVAFFSILSYLQQIFNDFLEHGGGDFLPSEESHTKDLPALPFGLT